MEVENVDSRRAADLGRSKLLRDIGVTFFSQLAAVPFSIAGGIILARALQPTAKGEYATAITFVTLVLSVGSLGIAKAMTYRLARNTVRPAAVRRTGVFTSALNGLVLGILAGAIAVIGVDTLFPGMPLGLLLMATPLCLIITLRGAWEGILRGEQRNHIVNVASVLQSATFVGLLAAVSAIWGLTPEAAIALFATSLVVAAIIGVVALGPRKAGLEGRVDWQIARSLCVWGIPYAIVAAAQSLNYRVDILMVQAFGSSAEVGYYSISASLVEMTWYLPVAVGFVVFPRTAAGRGSVAHAAETAVLMRWTFAALGLVAVLVMVAINPVIGGVFGDAYLPASDSARLLMPGALMMCSYMVLGSYLIGAGKLRSLVVASVMGAAINILLNLIVIPRYGINGAAVDTTISYSVTGLLVLRVFVRASSISPRELLLLTPAEIGKRLRVLAGR